MEQLWNTQKKKTILYLPKILSTRTKGPPLINLVNLVFKKLAVPFPIFKNLDTCHFPHKFPTLVSLFSSFFF